MRTATYDLQPNGLAERFEDTLEGKLTELDDNGRVEENLDIFLQTY